MLIPFQCVNQQFMLSYFYLRDNILNTMTLDKLHAHDKFLDKNIGTYAHRKYMLV